MRRMSWLATIPALALACATGSKNEKPSSEAVKTQSQAQAALQRAADAQKRALEEQQKAEQLQQEVVQKQKALADAQARLNAQRAKAQQAQREAQQLAAEAQQEAQREQTQAMQLQRQQAQTHQQLAQQNQQQWTQTRTVDGRVVSAGGNELTVRAPDQGDLKLKATDSTTVTVNGRSATLDQITPGEDVRASYQVIDGQPVALTVEARKPDSSSSQSNQTDTSNPKQ
jgi:dsDNA-specific endonuclease/ATPase MutS2